MKSYLFFSFYTSLLLLILSSFTACQPSFTKGTPYIQTYLYFGLSIGSEPIAESDWKAFADSVIVPKFPHGFTILPGEGQWQYENGESMREQSKIVMFLYTPKENRNTDIQYIIKSYCRTFQQEAVLRTDKKVYATFGRDE